MSVHRPEVTVIQVERVARDKLAFLDTLQARSHNEFPHADVAELADAQVSEACDGDIVEVQVLSSAPASDESELRLMGSLFFGVGHSEKDYIQSRFQSR